MVRSDGSGLHSKDAFRSLKSGPADPRELADDLTHQLSLLTAVLESVSDEARLMDANLNDTHEIVSRISRTVKHQIFGPRDLLQASAHPDIHGQFAQAHSDESDVYEVYADDLERHQIRQRKNLPIADSDADKFTVVKRRRTYIATLFDLCTQISEIIKQLTAQ